MTDPRLLKSNGRVAHVSLRGQVDAEAFVEGERRSVAVPVATLRDALDPAKRLRELVLHDTFVVLDESDGRCFGFAEKDGYVGTIASDLLAEPGFEPTHIVSARQSYLVGSPELKTGDEALPISHGSRLTVFATHEGGRWGEVDMRRRPSEIDRHKTGRTQYVPMAHLRPIAEVESDPVAVAERFLGTPYLWGGNSGFGLDCSGLVQAAFLACGLPCPGDSDMQMSLGEAAEGPARRGDLLFWKGHVAMVADETRIIHANARAMGVTYEDMEAAIARIEAQGDGPVTAHRRLP